MSRVGYKGGMQARTAARRLLVGFGILLLSVPLGMLVTLVLLPFWRWIEESTGIESVGHSGPADWCFLVSTAACALVLGLALSFARGTVRPDSAEAMAGSPKLEDRKRKRGGSEEKPRS